MDERELHDLLARYPLPFQPAESPVPLDGAGGYSGARLWRFRAAAGPMVLRAWPPDGPGRPHLEQVHRWLSRAGELDFIPVPVPDRHGATIQEHHGRLWELAPWMPGSAEVDTLPAMARVRSAFTALAAFHARLAGDRTEGPSPGLGRRYAAILELIRGGFDDLARAIGAAGTAATDRTRSLAERWMGTARAVAPRLLEPLRIAAGRVVRLQPCLRDARPEHFLFADDRVVGLLDFGAMGVDCVAGDLARLIGEWLRGDQAARAQALTAYELVRPLAPAETSLIDAFLSSSALLVGEHWIRWHYVEGRRFDDDTAVASRLGRGVQHLEELASRLGVTGCAPRRAEEIR